MEDFDGRVISDGNRSASSCSINGHVWRYVRGARGRLDGCDAPGLMRCAICAELLSVRCGSARASKCIPCAERKRRDIARIGRSGAQDSPTGLFFVTLTAPGADVLPWDTSRCSHSPEVACTGALGCVADRESAGRWNATAPQRWSWFIQYLRREIGGIEFFKTWETQRRGLLHLHGLVRVSRPITRRRMREIVQTCALQWEFGREVDVQHINGANGVEVARKAGYCAKYATKSSDDPATTARIDRDTGEILLAQGGYRSWSCSRGWGLTMKRLRAERLAYTQAAAPSGAGAPTAAAPAVALDLNSDIYTTASPGRRDS